MWVCRGMQVAVWSSSSGRKVLVGVESGGLLGLVVVYVLVDPVWRERWERVTAEGGFENVDAARRGVHGFLELT